MIRTTIFLLLLCICGTFRVFGQDEEKEITLPNTTMSIDENEYYFGKIAQGDIIKHDFEIRNTGVSPLIIYDSKSSCPCVTVTWPTDTIMPNGIGLIHVIYDSSTKIGPQAKQITVYANTEEQGIMYVKGEVRLPSDSVLIDYKREVEMKQLAEIENRWQKMQDSLREIKTWDYRMAHSDEYENTLLIDFIKNGLYDFAPPLTALKFTSPNFSFGRIEQGGMIRHSFVLTNKGENPLYLLKIQASRNVKINYPQHAVLPGLSGEITVELDTRDIHGSVKEQIVVSTNSLPVESILTIQGKVSKSK